jgi:hypothetical protein
MRILRLKRILGNLSLLSIALLLSFLSIEVLLRYLEYYGINRLQFDAYKIIYSDERDKEYIFGHKTNSAVKLEKGYYNFTFITNSEGLRETIDYDNINKSVIFLGDSIIEGASVENNETLSSIFQKHTGIISLNFGVGCYNTAHEYYWLKNKYREHYNTKLIVLGFCVNDMESNYELYCFDENIGNWRLYKNIELPQETLEGINNFDENAGNWKKRISPYIIKSKTLVFVIQNFKKMFMAEKNQPLFSKYKVTSKGRMYTEYFMKKVRDYCKGINSEFIVVIFPNKEEVTGKVNQEDRVGNILIDILNKNNIEYIDLFELLKSNFIAHPEVHWFWDDLHPYKPGHALIGKYLARKLSTRFPSIFKND